MRGIILAGGSGTRLHPLTISTSKQLLPVYDKPMIYYPLSILMIAGIREVLLITTEKDIDSYILLLGDGSQFGISIEYKIQKKPNGLAEAFILGEDFIGSQNVCLILGDNLFYGHGMQKILLEAKKEVETNYNAQVFGVEVASPKDFGIAKIDGNGKVISVEEKPIKPQSNIAITGLYFYPNNVIEYAKKIKPSKRGELEITSVNQKYLDQKKLHLKKLPRGVSWFDTGTHDDLVDASYFIKTIEKKTNLKIACLEEIAVNFKWISKEDVLNNIQFKKGVYYDYVSKKLKL
tara:strand:+ start:136 stop:1008 length:873 start_codon:yes stop_codon:yes gene_type:complete